MLICKPGDILLYRIHDKGLLGMAEGAVDVGEVLEDGPQIRLYHHVAIALDANNKIEADGKRVAIHPIANGVKFDVYRLPVKQTTVWLALLRLRKMVGERYDWLLILDLALRYLTRGRLHVPNRVIQSKERREKICSSLAAVFLQSVGWKGPKRWPPPSPEDIYLAIQQYRVTR